MIIISGVDFLVDLSYCVVSGIFIRGKNVGTTLTEVCHSFHSVEMAIVCDIVLCSFTDVHPFNDSYEGSLDLKKICLLVAPSIT